MNFTSLSILLPLFSLFSVISCASSSIDTKESVIEKKKTSISACPWDKEDCSKELGFISELSVEDLDSLLNVNAGLHLLHTIKNFEVMDALLKKTKAGLSVVCSSGGAPFTSQFYQFSAAKSSSEEENRIKLMALLLFHDAEDAEVKYPIDLPVVTENLKQRIQSALAALRAERSGDVSDDGEHNFTDIGSVDEKSDGDSSSSFC